MGLSERIASQPYPPNPPETYPMSVEAIASIYRLTNESNRPQPVI